MLAVLRPHQWVKNLLVFVPWLAVGAPLDDGGWQGCLMALGAFCLTASAVYVGNDMIDRAADRNHPRKRNRPFARGDLSVPFGLVLAPCLLLAGLAVGAASGIAGLLLLYAILSAAYSLALKKLPLVDVFLLGSFYALRVLAGGVASSHLVSLWLLAFSSFVFLSLGLVKRVAELRQWREDSWDFTRRGYSAEDLQLLEIMGIASSFISAMVLALYVQDITRTGFYRDPPMLWLAVPLLLFWQCRLWLVALRGIMHDDPVVFALKDRASWLVAILLGVIVLLARFSPLYGGLVVSSTPGLP